MSDEISVEGIRRIAEADDWKNFPGWKGTRALARLALRLRAEVERLKAQREALIMGNAAAAEEYLATIPDCACIETWGIHHPECPLVAFIAERRRSAEESAARSCAEIALQTWRSAPNTRESGFQQNELSHGCIAAAAAIRSEFGLGEEG